MKTTAMNKIFKGALYAALTPFMLTSMLVSCDVQEDLCEKEVDGVHAHKGGVQFNYVWDKMPAATAYDPSDENDERYVGMYIIADRVINNKSYTFRYNVRSENGKGLGRYLNPVPNPIPDPLGEGYTENANIRTFEVSTGEYKFLSMSYPKTFTFTEEEINQSRIENEDFIITPNPEKKDELNMDLRLGQFTCEYKTYSYDEMKDYYISSPFGDFDNSVDNNLYTSAPDDASEDEKEAKSAKFIRNVTAPIVVDSTTIHRVGDEELTVVDIHPKPITQNIDLYFDLKKKQTSSFQFFVSDVWCVLSGIPRKMNIGTGAVDITQTDKLIFQTKLVDPTKVPDANSEEMKPQAWSNEKITDHIGKYDNQAEDVVRCYANLNIPGIVENSVYTDANKYAGPGVLQIIVRVKYYGYSTDDNTWGWRSRTIMGRVNLHKNIEKAQLLELYNEKRDQEYWRKAQDYKRMHLAIDATLTQSLITGNDESPRVANWEEEQHIEEEY